MYGACFLVIKGGRYSLKMIIFGDRFHNYISDDVEKQTFYQCLQAEAFASASK